MYTCPCIVGWAIVEHCYVQTSSLVGDPRRPYPQDIEMRAGFLGRLSSSLLDVPDSETSQQVNSSKKLRLDSPPSRLFPGT